MSHYLLVTFVENQCTQLLKQANCFASMVFVWATSFAIGRLSHLKAIANVWVSKSYQLLLTSLEIVAVTLSY
ncbi:hypothetical protein GCM10009114_26440 [Aliiglaciecola litoralis]|uniref:MAPEG family protein n=1 Tax=Aliiglaciecola litoralis TaxID=582857 RepID=A0ABN1LMW2_9ALTE